MFTSKVEPRIRLKLKEHQTILSKDYRAGTIFHVVGENGMRGYDIVDPDGKEIGETGMISHYFEEVKD